VIRSLAQDAKDAKFTKRVEGGRRTEPLRGASLNPRGQRRRGRRVLVLDAVTGGDASRLYERLGWVRAGDIPG